jgi:DNA-binding PucR family transcriptional regulator
MDQANRIRTFQDVASLINSGGDLNAILMALLMAACRHAGWTMGSIMAIDVARGYAQVLCRYDPALLKRPLADQWELNTSPAIVALQRNDMVYIGDARESEEFPGYRREAHERDYRTVAVIPMACSDPDGKPLVLSVISRDILPVTEEDRALLGLIVHLGAIAVERHRRLEEERLAAERLRTALTVQESFLNQALSGAAISDLVHRVGRLLPHPILVVDFTTNTAAAGASPRPDAMSDDVWQQAVTLSLGQAIVRWARTALESHGRSTPLYIDHDGKRWSVTPQTVRLEVEGRAVGALLIFGTIEGGDDIQKMALDSASFALSILLMRNYERFRYENRNLSDLFNEIIEQRWHDVSDIVQRARRLDVNLEAPARVVIVEPAQRGCATEAQLTEWVQNGRRAINRMGMSATCFIFGSSLVFIIADEQKISMQPATLIGKLVQDIQFNNGKDVLIVPSERCASPLDYAAAWQNCRRLLRVGRIFDRSGLLTNAEFGPLPMLAAAAEVSDVRGFVQNSVGRIADHDKKHATAYLDTLSAYLREGCRPQATADALALHVSTLRYRLTRIEDLFEINVESPDRRFAIELAIHLHQMIA